MDTITPETSTPSSPTGGARNTFITVLCILTFIGSGWGLIKAIKGYATADFTANVVSGAMKNAEDQINEHGNAPGFVKGIMGSVMQDMNPDTLRKLAIFEFVANLLTLTGAILMFNLKKIGFFLYIAGIIVLITGPMAMGGLVGAIGASLVGFIGVIFIVLYGVNLKHMNK